MLHASRPQWRLFCLALGCSLMAAEAMAQSPALTTVRRHDIAGWQPGSAESMYPPRSSLANWSPAKLILPTSFRLNGSVA
jgi:hypothetical protein